MSEKVNLFNKKTALKKLKPFIISALTASIISGTYFFGTFVYNSYHLRKKEKEVVSLIEQQNYEPAKKLISSLFEDGIFDEKNKRAMVSAIGVADKVSELERKIADFDYADARRIFDKIKNNAGTSKLRNMGILEESIDRINSDNILKRAQEYLNEGFLTSSKKGIVQENEKKHKELKEDLFGLCLRNHGNKSYQSTLVNVLLNTKGVPNLGSNWKLLRQRLTGIADFSNEFSDVEIPITSYETLVNTVLDTARRRIYTGGRVNYTQATLFGDIGDLNAMLPIPKNLQKRIKRKIFTDYETVVRQAVHEDKDSSISVKGIYSLIDEFFRNANKHDYAILNHTLFQKYLPKDLRLPTEKELKELEKLKGEKLKHTKNLELSQQYLGEITNSFLPQRKYSEAYQKVLQGRRALMNDGIKNDEKIILSEYERLGLEITNLMRK